MANIIEVNSMEDIPIGAILELKNGDKYLYMGDKKNTIWKDKGECEYFCFYISGNKYGYQTFNKDMTVKPPYDEDYEIIRIYKHCSNYTIENKEFNSDNLLWEKEKVIMEISIKELEKIYGCKVKIVESEEE